VLGKLTSCTTETSHSLCHVSVLYKIKVCELDNKHH